MRCHKDSVAILVLSAHSTKLKWEPLG
jgi:hypothetical protein